MTVITILVIMAWKGYIIAHYTELKISLSKNMSEYYNLINRLGEGVLILAKDSISMHYEISFCN